MPVCKGCGEKYVDTGGPIGYCSGRCKSNGVTRSPLRPIQTVSVVEVTTGFTPSGNRAIENVMRASVGLPPKPEALRPHSTHPKVTLGPDVCECARCHGVFQRDQGVAGPTYRDEFCSPLCYEAARDGHAPSEREQAKCAECGKFGPIWGREKGAPFCAAQCAITYRRKHNPRTAAPSAPAPAGRQQPPLVSAAADGEHTQRAHRVGGAGPTLVLYTLRVGAKSTATPRNVWRPGSYLGSELMAFFPCAPQDAQLYTSSADVVKAIASARKRIAGLVPEMVTLVEETMNGAKAKVPANLWGDDLFEELERQGLIEPDRPPPPPHKCESCGTYYTLNPCGCPTCNPPD